jgi:O-antigen/teichoic acid export membrane protein
MSLPSLAWTWPSTAAVSRRLRARIRGRRTFVGFVSSVAAVNASSLLGNAFAFRWISPSVMGVWHTLLLASSYLVVVRLGLINGMGRELPFAIGRGDRALAERIAATSLAYNLGCSALVALVFGGSLLFSRPAGAAWRLGLATMAVVTAANLYLAYLQATFRSDSEFERLSRVQWLQSATGVLLPVAVWAYGFAGLCGHAVLQAVLVTTFAHAVRPFKMRPRFEPVLARGLLSTGFPLFVAGYLQTVATGFDRVILLHRGSVEMVGYYAPAVATLAAMAVVPGAVATYVYPKMSHALGSGRSPHALRRMAIVAAAASMAAGLPVAFAGWLAAPAAIARFFPRYVASVPAVRWSLAAGLLWGVSPAAQVLGSLKAWTALSTYVTVLVTSRWVFPWLLSRGATPLEGVARGNALAAAVMGVLSLFLVWRATALREGEEPAK